MDVIEGFLATEVLASIMMLGAIALVVRTYLHYAKDASELGPKLTDLQAQLVKLRTHIEPKRKVVSELTSLVQPLKEQAERFSQYYEKLHGIELEAKKMAVTNAESEEADKQHQLQHKRIGFEGSGGETQEE